mmetsp:Transcript_50290/g.155419  ORF Transcript_50290/g.155419 Transcript_50290/m.155419 type:complete len:234 (+) Transcript_50290:779-1480(+)
MILDMSWKYRLNNCRDLSGGRLSTIVVKEAMSEKKTVTSASFTSRFTSAPLRIKSCTTGQGTYFPQEMMPFLKASKVLRMTLSSLTDLEGASGEVTAANCSREMLSISSEISTKGRSKFRENQVRSLTSRPMPVRMMKMTTAVVHIAILAESSTALRSSRTATPVVRASKSCAEMDSPLKSGLRKRTRSKRRYGDLIKSSSMVVSKGRFLPQVLSVAPRAEAQEGPRRSKSLQ